MVARRPLDGTVLAVARVTMTNPDSNLPLLASDVGWPTCLALCLLTAAWARDADDRAREVRARGLGPAFARSFARACWGGR